MAHVKLSETSDYELVYEDQDIRGEEVLDARGQIVGIVDDMIVDTDAERVDTIVLEDGTTFPASEIYIGDDAVYVEEVVGDRTIRPVIEVYEDYGRVRRGRLS